MYGPDEFIYQTNLTLLSTLTEEELSDKELMAELTSGSGTIEIAKVGLELLKYAGNKILNWLAPSGDPSKATYIYWMYPPFV